MTSSQCANENSSVLFKKEITDTLFPQMRGEKRKRLQPPHPEALVISGFAMRNMKFLWHCSNRGRAERRGATVEDMVFADPRIHF